MAILIGEGSYGQILYNKECPNTVLKIHYLSSYEIEASNKEMLEHEYKFHQILHQATRDTNIIIPKPANLKCTDAVVYQMDKLNYPSTRLLAKIIKPEKIEAFVKTNPDVHAPPYLLYSDLSDDYENGRVKLLDMQGVEHWNNLYYTLDKTQWSWRFGETMITQFFNLTFETTTILQDVEFVLTENSNYLCVGLLDFNQVSDFDTRVKIARNRVSNYNLCNDIANTYLFLSGVDTGSILTDRNTQWKFLPTPNKLPHLFFSTVQKIQYDKMSDVIYNICSTLFDLEMDAVDKIGISDIFHKIMMWHELLIYGTIDTALFDKLNINYAEYDELVANNMVSAYSFFSQSVPFVLRCGNFDNYYIIKSVKNPFYLECMKQKQRIGIVSNNMVDIITSCDIMFQRLFLLKCLLRVGIKTINLNVFCKILEENMNFESIINFLLNKRP